MYYPLLIQVFFVWLVIFQSVGLIGWREGADCWDPTLRLNTIPWTQLANGSTYKNKFFLNIQETRNEGKAKVSPIIAH